MEELFDVILFLTFFMLFSLGSHWKNCFSISFTSIIVQTDYIYIAQKKPYLLYSVNSISTEFHKKIATEKLVSKKTIKKKYIGIQIIYNYSIKGNLNWKIAI